MLPTQVKLPIQMDIPPTQNIGLLDDGQPQIYSLLATPNSPATVKQHRRKKISKLDDTIPVMLNPHIARTPVGITFTAPNLHSTMMQESIPSFASPRPIQSNTYPFRVYIDPGPYDANNNINHHQIPSRSVPLNSSLIPQPQQNPTRSNEPLPPISTNSMSQMSTNLQLLEYNRLLNTLPNGRTTPTSSRPKKEYDTHIGQLIFTDQGSLLPSSHPIPSTSSSIPTSIIPPGKPKRKYSRRTQPLASVEQKPIQLVSQYPMSYTQSTVPHSLPSVSITNGSLEKQNVSVDMTTSSNFVPLSPPASISSIKSPPANTNNESSLIPIQQNLLPQTINNIVDVNQLPRQYFHNQGYSLARKVIKDPSINNFDRLLAAAHQPFYMIPSNSISGNILPMSYSSLVSGTVPSMPLLTDIKKEPKKRGGVRKSKIVQTLKEEVLMDKQNMASKPSPTEIQTARKRKRKNSNTKDIRTKIQLRHITRRNRLAVLKFMIQKRKQQHQQRISNIVLPEIKVEEKEEIIPKFVDAHVIKTEEMETNLAADIIAPSLKISFDALQKIESISLYYHRRRKPDITNENSFKSSINADNRLGLLLEALEFIEKKHGSSKLALPTVQ